ncbi:MAG: DUF3592 domain-containing protein [Pirellulales bacterium]
MPGLARYLRFYGKKRGDRRTGSRELGTFGFGCAYALCFAVGWGLLALILVYWAIPELRVNRDFVRHICRVTDVRLDRAPSGDTYAPRLHVEFEVKGKRYSVWAPYEITDPHMADRDATRKILDRFERGREYPCWYDPRDPQRVVLSRGYTWYTWLMLLLPISLIAIGGGGLSYYVWGWGKSAERRAALAGRSQRLDFFDREPDSQPWFPNVPGAAEVTNSPGTVLAFRLPSAGNSWGLAAGLIGCLIWNAVVSVFAVMAVRNHLAGQPDWRLTLFVVPFALVGLGLVIVLVRQLLISTGVGSTIVEISQHPLYPGGAYRVFVSQAGRLKMNWLAVSLICEEEATYRQGTNTRTVQRRVYQHELFRRQDFELQPRRPLEAQCSLDIPAGAMHSFRADHNQVSWKVVVQGNVVHWPDFERVFLVHVYPSGQGSEAA